MEEVDIEAAKRLKNTMWTPGLKEFYEPQDVIRYFDEVDRISNHPFKTFPTAITPPQKFFTEDVLKEGLILLKNRNLKNLQSELNYLKRIKIPNLEKEIVERYDPIDYNDYLTKEGWQHFLKGNIITSEFSGDVIYSIRTEKLTLDKIMERYGIHFKIE